MSNLISCRHFNLKGTGSSQTPCVSVPSSLDTVSAELFSLLQNCFSRSFSPVFTQEIKFAGHLFLTAQGRVDSGAAWLAVQHAVLLVPRMNIDCMSMEPLKHLRTVPANTQDSRQPPQPYTQSKAVPHHMITSSLTRTAGSGPKVPDHPVMS